MTMSVWNTTEDSILEEEFSMEDIHGDHHNCNDSKLLFEKHYEKFGISNVNGDLVEQLAPLEPKAESDYVPKQSSSSEEGLMCNSNSGSSFVSGVGYHDSVFPTKDAAILSSSLGSTDKLNSENLYHCQGEPTSNYLALESKKDQYNSDTITSDSSCISGFVQKLHMKPSKAVSTPTGAIAHQRQSSQEWVCFDDSKQDKLQPLSSSSAIALSSKPPEIPSRKRIPSNTSASLGGDINLLSINADESSLHLDLGASISSTHNYQVPPIPKRLLSQPQPSLASTSSTKGSVSKGFEVYLPPPHALSPSNSIKRRERARSAVMGTYSNNSSSSLTGPPVPPRKNLASVDGVSVPDTLPVLTTPTKSWVTFSEDKQRASDEISQNSQSPMPGVRSSVSSVGTDSINIKSQDGVKDDSVYDEKQWTTASTTSPTGSLKSIRKKKGGYQHLPDESDGEENIQPESNDIIAKVPDLSPVKPLSRWAPIPNEADDAGDSMKETSAHSSLVGEPVPDDLDADGVFVLSINRLSSDVSDLKGFNRADKGSQNNLVDFSGYGEKAGGSDGGSICDSSDDAELETVFDMTAQGDSLKRKRKKKPNLIEVDQLDSSVSPNLNVKTTSDASHSPFLGKNGEAGNLNSAESSAESKMNVSNISTNPFWRSSPLGDTVSLTSSTSESNPFDRIHFQAVGRLTPLSVTKPNKAISGFPTLPPPPGSAKGRNLSGSGRQTRTKDTSVTLPYTLSQQESESEQSDSRQLGLACVVDGASVHSLLSTSEKAENISLLDLQESNEKIECEVTAGITVQNSNDDSVLSNEFQHLPENISVPGTSQKDPSILETTLSILDVFANPSPEEDSPFNIQRADVQTYQALQATAGYPDLRQSSLDSLNRVKKSLSGESLQINASEDGGAKYFSKLQRDDLIPLAMEWNMLMRFPRRKYVMSSRKWVNIYVRLKISEVNYPTLQLYHNSSTKDPFYFIELAKHDWRITQPVLQDRFKSSESLKDVEPWARKRKVHTVKFLRVYYQEKHAFSSKQDKYLTGVPYGFKHSCKSKQTVKLGTERYLDMISLIRAVKNASFDANRRGQTVVKDGGTNAEEHKPLMKYHSRDEIVFDVTDEFQALVSSNGKIEACSVVVHVNVTSFLSGDPIATVAFNDVKVRGREVAKRVDIIPSSNEDWIEITDSAVHDCSKNAYEPHSASITFYPPDACRFELARLTCPYFKPDLPITVRATVCVRSAHIQLRCILRSSSQHSANKNELTQVPCEDLSIRFPLPDKWVPAFKRGGLLRKKSVHAKRIVKRPSNVARLPASGVAHAVLEASVGNAKYEIAYNAVVWRIPRFPEKNAAENTPRVLTCAIRLTSDLQLPRGDLMGDFKQAYSRCEVEYTMPSTTATGACVRSIHLPNTNRAEKFTSYCSHYFYKVGLAVTDERDEASSTEAGCAVQ